MSERNKSIDIARGICICCMVIIHGCSWWGQHPEINMFTGAWFLVFFFFCSGLVDERRHNISATIRKSFINLEIPYLLSTVTYVIYVSCTKNSIVASNLNEMIKIALGSIFYGFSGPVNNPYPFKVSNIGMGPIWFFQCMFVTKIVNRIIPNSRKWMPIRFLIAALAWVSMRYFTLPMAIQPAMIGLGFVSLGILCKSFYRWLDKFVKDCSLSLLIIMSVLSGYVLYVVVTHVPYQWMNLGQNVYHPQSLLSTIIGFTFLLLTSQLLQRLYLLDDAFSYIGKKSMIILIMHNLDILILRDWGHANNWSFVLFSPVIYLIILHCVDRMIHQCPEFSKKLKN